MSPRNKTFTLADLRCKRLLGMVAIDKLLKEKPYICYTWLPRGNIVIHPKGISTFYVTSSGKNGCRQCWARPNEIVRSSFFLRCWSRLTRDPYLTPWGPVIVWYFGPGMIFGWRYFGNHIVAEVYTEYRGNRYLKKSGSLADFSHTVRKFGLLAGLNLCCCYSSGAACSKYCSYLYEPNGTQLRIKRVEIVRSGQIYRPDKNFSKIIWSDYFLFNIFLTAGVASKSYNDFYSVFLRLVLRLNLKCSSLREIFIF